MEHVHELGKITPCPGCGQWWAYKSRCPRCGISLQLQGPVICGYCHPMTLPDRYTLARDAVDAICRALGVEMRCTDEGYDFRRSSEPGLL